MPVLIIPSNSVDMSLLGGGSTSLSPFKPVGVVQGTWTYGNGAGALQQQFYNATSADADECYWYVLLSQGTYTFQKVGMKDTNLGITKWYLDAVLIATFDLYAAASTQWSISEQTGIVVTSGKLFKLTVKIDGKNALSTNYKDFINGFQFIKTA